MHWPEVSEKKKQEIQHIKELMELKNKRRSAPPVKRANIPLATNSGYGSDNIRPNWNKFHNPMLPKPKLKKVPVVVDYLREIRVKNEENHHKSKNTTALDWDAIKDQNIDDKTKIELLKARTKLIEENAERKELINRVNGNLVEDDVDINDMLIDAIEMKLSILDQIE